MVSFPMEIYDAIMEEVDDSSQLCLIAQTARLFRPRAQRLIYRNIKLDISIRRTITVFKLLCGSPRLASYVHELNAAAFWYSEHGPCDYAFFSPVLRLLSRVLRNVINLRQLHLNSGLDRVPFSILRGELCHFKLHSLVTYYNPTENTLSGFIVQQTSIRRLEFRNASFSIKENFPPNVLPNLSVFMGNIVHAVRLIQHRPITHLFVTSTNPNPLAMSNLTALSSLRVKCIGLDANISSAILASLPQTFPSLEVLIFRRTDERNYLRRDVLPLLKHLRSLGLGWCGIPKDQVVRKLFVNEEWQFHPSLREVTFYTRDNPWGWQWEPGMSNLDGQRAETS